MDLVCLQELMTILCIFCVMHLQMLYKVASVETGKIHATPLKLQHTEHVAVLLLWLSRVKYYQICNKLLTSCVCF